MSLPDRRHALFTFANGFGLLGLAGVLADATSASGRDAVSAATDPLAVRPPHYAAKAKRVIFLFMSGGPSHVDLFDSKPKLKEFAGKPLPFEQPKLVRTKTVNLLPSPFKFAKHGQSGADVSELFPNLAKRVDDLCILRGMYADNINHNGACLQMNTGEQAFSRPSLGSWLLYGLGTENRNLPGFVVITPSQPAQGAPLWSNSFLPAAYQGTLVSNLNKPIENLADAGTDTTQQRRELDALGRLNALYQKGRENDTLLAARIASFELAFRMQKEAPEAFGIDGESKATKALYGVGDPATDIFGKQCLMARRLVERGVRMVQVYHTQTAKRSSCQLWDQHGGLRSELPANCLATDKPIAGLLEDLKARGLLKDTLVVWGGEFGRTPTAEGTDGREHQPFGFTMWMAGAGVKGGLTYGSTDDFGWHATENKVHVHDLHATILHLMGLDHEKLTFRHAGRDYRLTDVSGRVVKEVLA
ncbi:DUF1501 domain-containing protein [Fimbriiglobus ruber]|uniref:Sulfatase n=1 Tax=Fimbriiglobus ruber TaxID=1908690 RepID=A0A225ECZ1_9BACT|nr:DUF1501 domain-containing protein [Fimbriiglobus ruber]OWK47209.1 sulfatase [Fimbriiglobus ruber]